MKFISDENDITIHIKQNLINFNYYKKENIETYIKDLIIKIKKTFHKKISGSYIVNIYQNKNYGLIIELKKQYHIELFPDLIDLKLNVFYDSNILLELQDYYLISKYKNIYYNDDKFYININELTKKDRLCLSEFCNYIYGDNEKNIKSNLISIGQEH